MKTLICLLTVLSLCTTCIAQICPEPSNATWYSDNIGNVSEVYWNEPDTECDILYYEVQYSQDPFDPDLNEGILLSPIYDTYYVLEQFADEDSEAYIRPICDCDSDGEPDEGGFGEGSSGNGWFQMQVIILECDNCGGLTNYSTSIQVLNSGVIYSSEEEVPEVIYITTSDMPEEEQEWNIFLVETFSEDEMCNTVVSNEILTNVEVCNIEFCWIEIGVSSLAEWSYTILNNDETPPFIECPEDPLEFEITGDDSFEMLDLSEFFSISDDCSFEVTQSIAIDEVLEAGEYTVILNATDTQGNSSECSVNIVINGELECPEVENAEWHYHESNDYSEFYWTEPTEGCPILYYEIQYSIGGSFDPFLNEGTFITPLTGDYYSAADLFPDGSSEAYIRAICDCNDDDQPDDQGEPTDDASTGWTAMNLTIEEECDCGLLVADFPMSYTILNEGAVYSCGELPEDSYYFSPGHVDTGDGIGIDLGSSDFSSEEEINGDQIIVHNTLYIYSSFCNEIECFQDVSVETVEWTYTIIPDNEAPAISCSNEILEYEAGTEGFELPNLTSGVSAEDNCSFDVAQTPEAGMILEEGDHIVTFLATDSSGNTSTCDVTVNVSYLEAQEPTVVINNTQFEFSCSDNIPPVSYTASNLDTFDEIVISEFQTTENCVTQVTIFVDIIRDDIIPIQGDSWTYTISDEEAPTVSCNENEIVLFTSSDTIELPDLMENVIATDDCGDPNIEQFPEPGEMLAQGEHVLMFTVSDECGNSASCSVLVIVIEEDYSIETNLEVYQTIGCEDDYPEFEYSLGDGWMTEGITISENSNMSETECGELMTYQLIITTEQNIILGSWVYEVEKIDDTPPEFDSSTPVEISISCGEYDDIPLPTVTDSCSEVTMTIDEVFFGGPCNGTIGRTYIATDMCGNSSNFTQYIAITDTSPPLFETATQNIDLQCGMPVPPAPNVTVSDNCNSVEVEFLEEELDLECGYKIQRTWTATDECGNVATQSQVISFDDDEEPSIEECPDEIILVMNSDGLYEVGDYSSLFEAEDNCSANLTISQSPENTETIDSSLDYLTFTATDDCGNTSSCEVTLIYEIGDNVTELGNIDLTIFPNPSVGSFTAELPNQSEVVMKVYDSIGQELHEFKLNQGTNSIDLLDLSSGIYFGTLYSKDMKSYGRIELVIH